MHTTEDSQPRVLYIETYPSGSHGRILDLLKQHSSLRIDEILCGREHWRWLAIAAHYEILEQLQTLRPRPPDLILFSGPLNVGALVAMLPDSWRDIPRVVYFHESQWTYPSERYDPRPFVLSHIDAAHVADEIWFNSRYHRSTFWAAATSPEAPRRVRDLARRLRPALQAKCRVVYPPVEVVTEPIVDKSPSQRRRIVWNARWERDKRPDRFVQLLDRLTEAHLEFEVLILGAGNTDMGIVRSDLGIHAEHAILPGHLIGRAEYEAKLVTGDVFVSTADHEFFGVSALEAALAGATTVLPDALAYPETIPSAYFYTPGEIDDLARVTSHLLRKQQRVANPHRSDAARFAVSRTVPAFGEHCLRVITQRQY